MHKLFLHLMIAKNSSELTSFRAYDFATTVVEKEAVALVLDRLMTKN